MFNRDSEAKRAERAGLSDRDLAVVLKRAREIELDGHAASLAKLRQAADELNISPDALAQALREHGANSLLVPPPPQEITDAAPPQESEPTPMSQWLTGVAVAIGALFGAAGGAAIASADSTTESAVFLVAAVSLVLTALHRRSRNLWLHTGQQVAMWASFTYAFVAALPNGPRLGVWQETGLIIGMIGASTAICVGTTLLWSMRAWRRRRAKKLLRTLTSDPAFTAAQTSSSKPKKKKTGVRAIFARLTGSWHTPNPSH